jgi:16S rRNA (guanine966-N2)-methyltransferase
VRIVAGEFGGRPIVAPRGRRTRPTSDRAREGLFSALESRMGAELGSASVLDAFAGSGALGLEALSRGAGRATFVENDGGALRALRANIDSLGVRSRAAVAPVEVFSSVARHALPGAPFSLLFLDPPYRIESSEVRALIEALSEAGNLAEGALIVWEHASAITVDWPATVEPLFDLSYGSTHIDAGVFARGGAA